MGYLPPIKQRKVEKEVSVNFISSRDEPIKVPKQGGYENMQEDNHMYAVYAADVG